MSFLNDRDIRRLCFTPEYYKDPPAELQVREDFTKEFMSAPYSKHEQHVMAQNSSQINRFDEEVHDFVPMIEPFEPQQVRRRLARSITTTTPINTRIRDSLEEIENIVLRSNNNDHDKLLNSEWFDGETKHQYKVKPCISYGLTSAGYDVRIGRKFKIFTNVGGVIDPLNMQEQSFMDYEGDELIIPPNSYALGHTMEYFNIPNNVIVICLGKSTYARAGLSVNVTPIEPGFRGNVVIELGNLTPLPIKVYANQGISQFMFAKMSADAEVSYGDRNGKYQGQTGVVVARA